VKSHPSDRSTGKAKRRLKSWGIHTLAYGEWQ
jgi:hypothetical protein